MDPADRDRLTRLEVRVAQIEVDADRHRVSRRQMLVLLIGSLMAFAGTLLVALLNHFVFT